MSRILDDYSHKPSISGGFKYKTFNIDDKDSLYAPPVKVIHYTEPDHSGVFKYKNLNNELNGKPLMKTLYKTFNIDDYGSLHKQHKNKSQHIKHLEYLEKVRNGHQHYDPNRNIIYRPHQTQQEYQKQYEALKPKKRKNAIKNNKVTPYPVFVVS